MADKRIDELEEATAITANDLFVLEQANTAKKLTGQTMTNFLLALANGHGGISTIAKTSSSGTNPVVDTYTITFADNTTTTFQVTNGVKGDQGPRGYTGNPGADITITSTSVTYQAWTSGTEYPTGTWVDNPPSVSQGGYLWTRTIVNYSDGGQTVAYSVARMGVDGSGSVSTVSGVSPDGSGNVQLAASDVGALPSSYQAPVTSVNGETGAVNLVASDVGAVAGDSVSKTISASGWYRVLKHTGSIPDGGIIKFKIGRNQNGDCHEIDLYVPHGHSFVNEISTSGTNQGITKIRLTQGSTYLYVDIYYALSATSIVRADFVPAGTITQSNIAAESLQSVADAPSGETVVATYVFAGNTEIPRKTFSPTVGAAYGDFGGCWYAREGKHCHIHVGIVGITANTGTTVYTLPPDMIPPTMVLALGMSDFLSPARIVVYANGSVEVLTSTTSALLDIDYYVE